MNLASWAKKLVVFCFLFTFISGNVLLALSPNSVKANESSDNLKLTLQGIAYYANKYKGKSTDYIKEPLSEQKKLAQLLRSASQKKELIEKTYPKIDTTYIGKFEPQLGMSTYENADYVTEYRIKNGENLYVSQFSEQLILHQNLLVVALANLLPSLVASGIVPSIIDSGSGGLKTSCDEYYANSKNLFIKNNIKILKDKNYTNYEAQTLTHQAGNTDVMVGSFPFSEAYAALCSNPSMDIFNNQKLYSAIFLKLLSEQVEIAKLYRSVIFDFKILDAVSKEKNPDGVLFTKDGGGTFSGKPISREDILESAKNNIIPLAFGIGDQEAAKENDAKTSAEIYEGVITNLFGNGATSGSGADLYRKAKVSHAELKSHISNVHALSFILFSEGAKKYSKTGYKVGDGTYDNLISGGANVDTTNSPIIQCVANKSCATNKIIDSVHELLKEFAPYDVGGAIYENVTKVGDRTDKYFDNTIAKDGQYEEDPCYVPQGGLRKYIPNYLSKAGFVGSMCSVTILAHQMISSVLYSSAKILQRQTGGVIENSADSKVGCTEKAALGNTGACELKPNDPEPGADYDLFGSFDIGDLVRPIQDIVVSDHSFGSVVQSAYDGVLRAVNVVLVVLLIFLAIINILQIQVNTYGISKILPTLLLGFLLAQGSMFLIRASLEVTEKLTGGILSLGIKEENQTDRNDFSGFINAFSSFPFSVKEIATTNNSCPAEGYRQRAWMTTKCYKLDEANTSDKDNYIDTSKLFKLTLSNIFTLVAALMLLILGLQFLLRRFVFFFLIPLAPLAALAFGFPPAQSLWNKWFKNFSSWLLMPVVAVFWVWLALVWFSAASKSMASDGGILSGIVSYAFGMVALYAAIKSPSTMVGDVKIAGNMMNKFVDGTLNKPVSAVGNAAGKGISNGWLRAREKAQYKINEVTPIGAMKRNKAKNDALWSEKMKEQMDGDVFKGKAARALGGDRFNRSKERDWKDLDHLKQTQKSQSDKVKEDAAGQFYKTADRMNEAGSNAMRDEITKENAEKLKKKINTQKNKTKGSLYTEWKLAHSNNKDADTEEYESDLKITKDLHVDNKQYTAAEARNRAAKEIGKKEEEGYEASLQTAADLVVASKRDQLHKVEAEMIESKKQAALAKRAKGQVLTEVLKPALIKVVDEDKYGSLTSAQKAENDANVAINNSRLSDSRKLREAIAITSAINEGDGKDYEKEVRKENAIIGTAVGISAEINLLLDKAKSEELTDSERGQIHSQINDKMVNFKAFTGTTDDKKFEGFNTAAITALKSPEEIDAFKNNFTEAYHAHYNIVGGRDEKTISKAAAAMANEEADAAGLQRQAAAALKTDSAKLDLQRAMVGDWHEMKSNKERTEARDNLASITKRMRDGSITTEEKSDFINMVLSNDTILTRMSTDTASKGQLKTDLKVMMKTANVQETRTLWSGMEAEYQTEKIGVSGGAVDNPINLAGTIGAEFRENNVKIKGAFETNRARYHERTNPQKIQGG